jgi:magnesium transporter
MEKKQLQFGMINRAHYTKPSAEQIIHVCEEYLLHDLVVEDMMESFTQDKIDVYDDHLFLVVHFPKYSLLQKKYTLNEFNIIIKQNNLVTFCSQQTSEITKIAELCKSMMKESVGDDDERHIVSPYFIVYRLLDGMYSKALLSLKKLTKDLMKLEEEIFDTDHVHKELIEELMIKRRNIIVMKHTFVSHNEIIEELHQATVKLFEGELDVYFEDLQYKVERINNQIQ